MPITNTFVFLRKDYRSSPDIFISEFPVRCNGSFCHQRNIIPVNSFRLCPECRMAKRRHNITERTRQRNRDRANRARQVLRYNRAFEKYERRGGFRPFGLRALQAFKRLTGLEVA